MDDLMDMIVADESPSDISDKIKEVLYTRAAEKVDNTRPNVALSMFDTEQETDVEVDAEE
jgi:hypothetical protein|tara:strand:+ start:940 stop:1119 length:180 start_codon:yes stop_codon:yes gene_type:complete